MIGHGHGIGASLARVEDRRLLTGSARFVDDLHLDGMLHAVVVRSTLPHGTLHSVDLEAARQSPGVRAVFAAHHVSAAYEGVVPRVPIRAIRIPELLALEQPAIASGKVRYVGEPIAVVVADTQAEAEDGADLVTAHIDPLAPVMDCHAAAAGHHLLFDRPEGNRAITYTASKGSAHACIAAYARKEVFRVQRHSGFPLETRGLVADWDAAAGRMTVYGAAKLPFFARRALAGLMRLPLEAVDMIELDVGGSFGIRGEFYPEDFLIPYASRLLGRPVKWIEDRLENLLGSNHSREMECTLEILCRDGGRIEALRGTVAVDGGAYVRAAGVIPARFSGLLLSGPYDIPNIHVESTYFLTNKAPIGTYRGPGVFEADFFRERIFDLAARDLGIDQIEFRRRNLVRADQMPYRLATLDLPPEEDELDTGEYRAALDRCIEAFDWAGKAHLQGRLVNGKYHGLGIGCFVDGGAGGVREHARIVLEASGRVTIYVGSASVGQGLVTVLTQIASEALFMPANEIDIRHGSTTYLKDGVGSGYSRSTVMGGSVVVVACGKLKDLVRDAAARTWACPASEVEVGPALVATHAGRTIKRHDLVKLSLSAEAEFVNHRHTYAFGAAAAHVTVDCRTGRVEVLAYYTVEDLGRVINPLTARGQAVGAAVQGLGGALLENIVYDRDGQMLTGTLADYMMPTATDFPVVHAEVTGAYPATNNPLGAKGGGEGGIVPVGGVIANAVAAALSSLGVEPMSLPLSPEAVWRLMKASGDQPLRADPVATLV